MAIALAALLLGVVTVDAATYGNAWAWGQNSYGEVGDGTLTYRPAPVLIHTPPGVHFVTAAEGNSNGVALDDTGSLWTWGSRLGDGSAGTSTVPVRATMPTGTAFTQISAGDVFTVALDRAGNVWEWGQDSVGGVFGAPGAAGSLTPVRVAMPAGVTFAQVAAGPYGTVVARDNRGRVWAWGDNRTGEAGDGMKESAVTRPQLVQFPAGVTLTSVSAGGIGGGYGGAHEVALDSNGNAWSWGDNSAGEVGINSGEQVIDTPHEVPMPSSVRFTNVLAAGATTLAIDSTGRIWAWGTDLGGDLGNGPAMVFEAAAPTGTSAAPTALVPRRLATPAGTRYAAVTCGSSFCIATDTNGSELFLGGSLGTAPAHVPVTVEQPPGAQFTALFSGTTASTVIALTGSLTTTTQLSTIASSLASPFDAFLPVSTVVTSVAIAAGGALLITFPANLFNLTFQENYATIRAWWEPKLRPFRRLRPRRKASGGPTSSRGAFIAVVLVGALLAGFNDPTFGLNSKSIATYLATTGAILAGIAVSAVITAQYHRRRHGSAPLTLRALPAGLAVAAACVVVSRLSGFQPGYLYGVVCGVVFARQLSRSEQGHVVALTTLGTLAVAVVAWFLWVPVNSLASGSQPFVGAVFLDDLLASVFVSGVVGSVIALLPLEFLPGATLRRWRLDAWFAVFGAAFFLLVEVMLRPHGSRSSSTPLVTTVVLFVVFAALSIGFREHFARRRRAASGLQPRGARAVIRDLLRPMPDQPGPGTAR